MDVDRNLTLVTITTKVGGIKKMEVIAGPEKNVTL